MPTWGPEGGVKKSKKMPTSFMNYPFGPASLCLAWNLGMAAEDPD